MLLDQIAFLDQRIAALSARGAELTTAMPAAWGINGDGHRPGRRCRTGCRSAARRDQAGGDPSAPTWPGPSSPRSGLDMSRFPTAAHLVSWAGLCLQPPVRYPHPDREKRRGQHLAPRRPRPGAEWCRRPAGRASEPPDSALRGKAKAQVAVAVLLLVIDLDLLLKSDHRFTNLLPLRPGPPQHRPQTEEPHPADPGPRLRRHHRQGPLGHTIQPARPDYRARPGSAAARPFPALIFRSVVTGLVRHECQAPLDVRHRGFT